MAIGCFASICRDRLGDRLLAFARAWPGVDIGVHEMPRGELLAGVRSGELALAVAPGNEQDDLQSAALWRDEALVAMAPDHPLAAREKLQPADLLDQRFMISRQQHGGDTHRFLASRVAPLSPLTGVLCNMGLPRLIELVAAGEGLALICASHTALLQGRVVVRSVEAPGVKFPVRAFWHDDRPGWPLDALIATLRAPGT